MAQRGQAAQDALNVFYWLTYPGAVDLDSIQDDSVKASLCAQMENFGQTPLQIFRKHHPPRLSKVPQALKKSDFVGFSLRLPPEDSVSSSSSTPPLGVFPLVLPNTSKDNLAFALVYSSGRVCSCRLFGVSEGKVPMRLEVASSVLHATGRWAAERLSLACSPGASDGCTLFSGGDWDEKWRALSLFAAGKEAIVGKHYHLAPISCIASSFDGRTLVTGSSDTTSVVWELDGRDGEIWRGCGHDLTVVCVALCEELQLVASGSVDGTAKVWSKHRARLLMTVRGRGGPIDHVALLADGVLLTCTAEWVSCWSLRGELLHEMSVKSRVMGFSVVGPSRVAILERERVSLYCSSLRSTLCVFPSEEAPISAICVMGDFILATHSQGRVSVFPI